MSGSGSGSTLRDIESEVIEWLEIMIGRQSGHGLGYPSSYDLTNPRGTRKKNTPTPPDFPRRLRVCDLAVRTLDQKLIEALEAKYLLLDTTDFIRATWLGISRSQYYRRVEKAFDWLQLAFEIAERVEREKNREMA